MALPTGEVRSRLQGLLRRLVPVARAKAESASGKTSRRRPFYYNSSGRNGYRYRNQTQLLDVARFGLLSIATLPFSLWVSLYSWNYLNRISLCQEALAQEDNEISHIRRSRNQDSNNNSERPCIGRERPLAEVRTLLANQPHQIIVVAGSNESGKSRFVSEILKDLPLHVV